jgi:hypothetical protein
LRDARSSVTTKVQLWRLHATTHNRSVTEIIASKVRPLRYTQIVTGAVFAGKVNPGLPLFLAQMAYQHPEAYVEALGLKAYGITTATFFDPTQFA